MILIVFWGQTINKVKSKEGMKKRAIICLFCILWYSFLYGETLILAKLKGVPDQAIGEFVLKNAYENLGIELKFAVLPAGRALMHTREGVVDGEIQRLPIIEKSSPTLIRVPTSIGPLDACIFFTKQIRYTSLEDLGEYVFVYVIGIKSYDPLLKFFKKSHAVVNQAQSFKMIDLGRADLTATGRIGGLYQLKQLGIKGIYPLDPPMKKYHLYHYLHEGHRDLVPRIDQVLQNLSKTGELERLRTQAVENLFNSIREK